MAIELEHRFGRNSRVRDYWLAASEGFAVQSADGRRVGTVRQVVHERDGRAVALVVEARRGLVRTDEVVLEAEAVEEVAPWRSTLVVPPREVPAPEPAVRWAALRARAVARISSSARSAAAAMGREFARARAHAAADSRDGAELVRTHWPSVRARLLRAWAWSVAALVGLVGAAAMLVARLLRALAARVAAARSAARS